MPLCSCLSQKSTIDAVHQDTRPLGQKPYASTASKQVKVMPPDKTEDMSITSPKGTTLTSVTETISPSASSLGCSLDHILHADDDKFFEFVGQITSSLNEYNSRCNIPPQINVPPLDPAFLVTPADKLKSPSLAATAERLEHIHTKVLHLQFENDAMKAINVRLFEHVKTLRTQIAQSSAVSSSFEISSPMSLSKSLEESKTVQELSDKLSKQEALLEKQRVKNEKLKVKLTEKKNACKSLLKGHILQEDSDSVPRSITANPNAVYVERLHFEKELDVLELEVRCLQKELSTALDHLDRFREEQIRDKLVIESLRKELHEKKALIESMTQASHGTHNSIASSASPLDYVPKDTTESQTSAAQDMLQELSSLLQVKEVEKELAAVDDDVPSMSKFLQLRKLQKELSSAQRQIRDQQRELKVLASTNGISEFMKLWRSEKESLEKRIYELEHELQRSIRSKHDASFYSAEESSISSNTTSRSIYTHSSEKSPRPVSPSYFLNAQVGWLQGLDISRGGQ